MLSRFVRITAAVLSGVTASLLVGATTTQAAQNRPVVVYGEPQSVNIERVAYGDLNLAESADRKTLFGRVGGAVRNVCNFDAVGIANDYRTCAGLAWKDARPQIGAALARRTGWPRTGIRRSPPVQSPSAPVRAEPPIMERAGHPARRARFLQSSRMCPSTPSRPVPRRSNVTGFTRARVDGIWGHHLPLELATQTAGWQSQLHGAPEIWLPPARCHSACATRQCR